MKNYILNEKREVIEAGFIAWAHFFEDASKRIVGRDNIGPWSVSTVFVGGVHEEVLFETMEFPAQEELARLSTWEAAAAYHELICNTARILNGEDPC